MAEQSEKALSSESQESERANTGASTDPYIGRVLGGRYELREKIGEGGMGLVYRAVQKELGRNVVIKLLNQQSLTRETAIERFKREARGLSRFDHRNIVTIHDFGTDDELSYLAMEYVDGYRLNDLVRQQDGLGLKLFCRIAGQLLDAIGEAHDENLIHRDLKPSNLMLTEKRSEPYFLKVLDFGLAKLVSDDSNLTGTNKVVGSVAFLSPEQITGENVDQRADVYALGIVFYYMLTGRRPFSGNTKSILYSQVHEEPPPIEKHLPEDHDIPGELMQLVRACVRKDPEKRPRDANFVLGCLREIVEDTDLLEELSGTIPANPVEREEGDDSSLLETISTVEEQVADDDSDPFEEHAPTLGADEIAERTSERSGAFVGAIVACVLVVGAGVFWWINRGPPGQTQQRPGAASKVEEPTQKNFDFSPIEQLIREGAFAEAKAELSNLERAGAPAEALSSYRKQIGLRKNVNAVSDSLEEAAVAGQLEAYENVMEVDPDGGSDAEKLAYLQKRGILKISDVPEGTTVKVDGKKVGQAPFRKTIEASSYYVELEKDGFSSWSKRVEVDPVSIAEVEPKLDKKQARPNVPTGDKGTKRPEEPAKKKAKKDKRADKDDKLAKPEPESSPPDDEKDKQQKNDEPTDLLPVE